MPHLAGDITRVHLQPCSITLEVIFYNFTYSQFRNFTMESVHHVSVSSKILFSKVRKIVPPMLEKFHKGMLIRSIYHAMNIPADY